MSSCSLNQNYDKWEKAVEEVTKNNPEATDKAIKKAVMDSVYSDYIRSKMSEPEVSVFDYHRDATDGYVTVDGKQKLVIEVNSDEAGIYTLGLEDGKKYTFVDGKATGIEVDSGKEVTIKQMKLIEERVGTQSELASGKKKIKRTKRHTELKKKIWKDPKAMMELYDELDMIDTGEDKEHKQYLRKVLEEIVDSTEPILNKFKLYVDKNAKANGGMVQIGRGQKSTGEVVLEFTKSDTVEAGEMGATEVYLHEIYHMSVEAAMKFRKGDVSTVIRSLTKIHEQAAKEISWKMLQVEGETAESAKDRWSKIFDSRDSLSEFIAYGMTNKKMKELLSNIEYDSEVDSGEERGLFSWLANRVIAMYNAIREATVEEGTLDDKLVLLAGKLQDHNNVTVDKTGVYSQIQRVADSGRMLVDKGIIKSVTASANVMGSSLDWVYEHNKKNVVGQSAYIVRTAGKMINPWIDAKTKIERTRTSAILSQYGDSDISPGWGAIFAPEGTIVSWLNYLSKDDRLTTLIEKMGLINAKIDSDRMDKMKVVGGMVKAALGDVSTKEQVILSRIVLENDLQALSDKYTLEEIGALLGNKTKLNEAISKERAELDKVVWNTRARNYMKSQTMGLGRVMATGISGSSVNKNASDIFFMRDTLTIREDALLPPKNKHALGVEIVDRLATLEAIKYSKIGERRTVAKMIKSNPDGVKTVMAVHKVQQMETITYNMDKAKASGGKDKIARINKGEIKDTSEHGMQSKVSYGDKKTEARMKRDGFKKKGETGVKGLWLYVSSVNGMPGFDKQAAAKINEGKRLHNLVGVMNGSVLAEKMKLNNKEMEEELGKKAVKVATGDVVKIALAKIHNNMLDDVAKQFGEIVEPELDGYIKLGKLEGGLNNYGVSVDKRLIENAMRQDNKAPILLGKMVAEIKEKKTATKHNEELFEIIVKDMKNMQNKKDPLYIQIGPDAHYRGQTEREFSKRLFKDMPDNMRKKVMAMDGKKYIAVRRDLATMYFGARAPSILNMKVPFSKKTIRDKLHDTKAGTVIAAQMVLAGEIWSEVVSMIKVDIVIKTPKVLINNIISNLAYSAALGQAPWVTAKNQMEMFVETKRYVDEKARLDKLQFDYKVNHTSIDKDKKVEMKLEIRKLTRSLENNAVHDLMVAGLFTSIVDNLGDKDLHSKSRLKNLMDNNKLVSKVDKKIPTIVKDGASMLYMTQDTELFTMLQLATQYSDFVARANRYHFLIAKGNSKQAAMKMILDEFVNYNRIDSTSMRWLNEMGFTWFTKYFFGSNKSMFEKMANQPSAVAGMMMMGDVANPTDAFFLEKDYGYAINGLWDTGWDGTMEHIIPPSTLELVW